MAHDWACDRNTIHDGVFLLRAVESLWSLEGPSDRSSPQVAGGLRRQSRSLADSRSSPTCGKRGIDGGKKVKGIKINILVDKHGFPLAVHISTANVHDSIGIIPALKEVSANGFHGNVLGDTSYQGENLKTSGQDLGIEVETKVCGANSFQAKSDGSSSGPSLGSAAIAG